jgi:YVTN family beta-propeller protein
MNAHEILAWDMAMDANKLPSLSLPPVVTNPGALVSVTGTAVSRQISGTDPENDPLVFTATNLPAGLTINAGGLISGIPTATGSQTVSVSASDGVNPAVSVSFLWTVNAPFELTPLAGGAVGSGATRNFTASATGGNNLRFKWNFGDGSPETAFASSPNASHLFANPGRYLVTLTVTDDTGRTLTTSFHQGVSAPLTARAPSASSSIVVERRSTGNHRVWVANPDADTVAVIDAVTRAKLAEIAVAASPRTLAVAPDGRIWVACARGTAISIISPSTLACRAFSAHFRSVTS